MFMLPSPLNPARHPGNAMRPLFIALVGFIFAAPDLAADTFGDITGVVLVRVYDGDTFFVDIPELHPLVGDEIGIRVRGVDTPEIRARCDDERDLAYAARRLAEETLSGARSIDLIAIERGRYFRIVATVLVDGVDLAETLIAAGVGVPYTGKGPRHSWCE